MNYSILSLSKVQRLFAVLAILALVFGPFANVQFAQAARSAVLPTGILNANTQVDVCHKNEGVKGYSLVQAKAGDIVGGDNNGHPVTNSIHVDDIIPPFDYDFGTGTASFDGRNWDQDIFSNGCIEPVVVIPTYVDLAVSKIVNLSNPAVAEVLTYTITVTNNGTAVATDVVVADTLEAGLTFSSANPIPTNTDPLQWEFASIATGTSEVITVNVEVASGTEGLTLTNEVSVSSEEDDNDTDDNSDSVDVTVTVPVSGCTDQSALNFDRTATVDDGSCTYMCAYSDSATTINGAPSVLTWVHNAWTDVFQDENSPAEWIWDAVDVVTPNPQTLAFTKAFYADASADAELRIAVDNTYTATFNGVPVTCDGSGDQNHVTPDTCSISVQAGLNTLVVEATNGTGPVDAKANPAGLIFDIITENATCENALPNGGSITIVKDFADDAPESWSFDFTGDLGDFTLEDGDDSVTFTNLEADEYLFNETIVGNWSTPAVSCTDGSGAGQGDDQLVVVLGEGEDVTCTFTNREKAPEAPACIGGNLLLNGSFEDPIIDTDWTLLDTVANWVISGVTQFEIWNTFNGSGNDVADDGSQNLELDSTGSGTVTQTVNTVAGNEYKVSFAFSPRAGVIDNEVEVRADGVVLGTAAADGTANNGNVWEDHYFIFTATDATTDISFADISAADSLGTLVDDTQVCLTDDEGGNQPTLYRVSGQVWHDENTNDERDTDGEEFLENTLEGWLVTITDGDGFVATTTSDEYGDYSFMVPAGEYTVTQETREGWALTYPNDGVWEICVPIECGDMDMAFLEQVMSFVIPTAHAAIAANNNALDFGNVRTAPGYSQGSYGGGNGNGRSISLRDNDPDGEVAGDSTSRPEGEVLGDATSVMPVGAPNTGAGGASQNVPSAQLHALLAILSATPVRKKHG